MDTMDPYEQQLLAVFESCDDYSQNTLSSTGLYQLCEKLELEDHYHKLLTNVLGESQGNRISFNEFRDGLLKLLSASECEGRNGEVISPVRELSPKSVFNRKKYGRSSRRGSIDNENQMIDIIDDIHHSILSFGSDNDSGSKETVPKKRKTRSAKRKDASEMQQTDRDSKSQLSLSPPGSFTINGEEECLITAWSTVSKGIGNSLSRDELVRVFQCVGLESGSEEAAQRVFEKLEVEENGSITLQELLEFIRSGVSWSKDIKNQETESEVCQKNFDYLEPPVMGCITGAYLVEQWEIAGVPDATHLLHKLGFSETQQIDLTSLIARLSDELKIFNDDKSGRRNLDPSTALLLAITVVQNIQSQSLKSIVEHLNAEKEKLRSDVVEANQRALLLAQEIDDHHSKLEHSTKQQVKILEQRHVEKIRELTLQLKSEEDAQASHITNLENKLSDLESERNKYKSIVIQLERENKNLEQERRAVLDQLRAVQRLKEKLETDLESLSNLQQKATEMEAAVSNNEIMSLLERIHSLESENMNLRDRNDELTTEVEELSAKLHNTSLKKRSSPINTLCVNANETMEEGPFVGSGTKRRGDSFDLIESADDSGGEEGSPRLGKVRKCSPMKDFFSTTCSLEGLRIHVADRGENLKNDSSPNAAKLNVLEEVCTDRSFVMQNVSISQELEQIVNSGELSNVAEKMKLLEEQFAALESDRAKALMNHVKELLNIYGKNSNSCKGCLMGDKNLKEYEELKKSRTELEEKTQSLSERCKNLESSLELLKEEYEKTEDYWSEKLEDERSFFEEEQKLSDKRYTELIDKILEYEEMLAAEREQRQRLETIDEKDGFEKQVMDLEQECYELKSEFGEAMKEKDSEIAKLKEEIKMLKGSSSLNDASVQVNERLLIKGCETEYELAKNDDESKKRSKKYSKRSFTFSSGDKKSHYCGCCHGNQSSKTGCGDLRNLHDSKRQLEREIEILMSERELVYKELMEKRKELNTYAFNANGVGRKFNEMEDKCHSLMTTLRQQQKQTEEILKSTWRQHKTEVKDLKSVLKLTEEKLKRQTEVIQEQLNKLARTDILVKDLFVENAYLISSVQKLEQKCQTGKTEDVIV